MDILSLKDLLGKKVFKLVVGYFVEFIEKLALESDNKLDDAIVEVIKDALKKVGLLD